MQLDLSSHYNQMQRKFQTQTFGFTSNIVHEVPWVQTTIFEMVPKLPICKFQKSTIWYIPFPFSKYIQVIFKLQN